MASRPSPVTFPRPPAVGIDVVDLADPRCRGKAADRRFVERILHASEAAAVASDPDPDRALWRLWAAKEAAFKVVSKTEGAPPPFVHAAFRMDGDLVRWRAREVPVRLEERGEALVVVAWEAESGDLDVRWDVAEAGAVDPDPGLDLDALVRRHLHEAERPPVHSRPSALVRLAARRALAEALAAPEARVAVVCPGGPAGRVPPVAHLDGQRAPADVSLSHHGRYLAWAVRVSGRGGGPDHRPGEGA